VTTDDVNITLRYIRTVITTSVTLYKCPSCDQYTIKFIPIDGIADCWNPSCSCRLYVSTQRLMEKLYPDYITFTEEDIEEIKSSRTSLGSETPQKII